MSSHGALLGLDLQQGILTSALLTLGSDDSLLWGIALRTVGWLAAALTSIHCLLVVTQL